MDHDGLRALLAGIDFSDIRGLETTEEERTFRVYSLYYQNLALIIGGEYGSDFDHLHGIHLAMKALKPFKKIQGRKLTIGQAAQMERELKRSWANLGFVHGQVEDPDLFIRESNLWLPVQAYYCVYPAIRAYFHASNQDVDTNHRTSLRHLSKDVARGLFPYPWSALCRGCSDLGTLSYGGFPIEPDPSLVSPLENLLPGTSHHRLALFLKTTRKRAVERKFDELRQKPRSSGRSRRNLNIVEKEQQSKLARPATVFDLFWRVRKKANYEESDDLVLGAASDSQAYQLAEALIVCADASVAVLEFAIAACIGKSQLLALMEGYRSKTKKRPNLPLDTRVEYWAS